MFVAMGGDRLRRGWMKPGLRAEVPAASKKSGNKTTANEQYLLAA